MNKQDRPAPVAVSQLGRFAEVETMWRACFLAVGIYMMILGVECLGVETVKLKLHEKPPSPSAPWEQQAEAGPARTITPPIWAPWSLLSCGAVVCLYSFTIPRRVKGQ